MRPSAIRKDRDGLAYLASGGKKMTPHEIRGCWINGRYLSWCNCGTIIHYSPHTRKMVVTLCTRPPRHDRMLLKHIYIQPEDAPMRIRMYAHLQDSVLARRPQHVMDVVDASLPREEPRLDAAALDVWARFINTSF